MAVIITDSAGVVTTWSPEAERLYRWSASEAVGTPIQELTVGPTSAEVAEQIMASVLMGEAWEGEFTARRRDGSTIEVHVIDLPVTGPDGTIAGIVGLSFDVSRSRAELRAEVDRIADIASWMARARADERGRLGRDLHDELGQMLTVLRTELLRCCDVQAEALSTGLQPLVSVVDACLTEIRRITHDLRHDPLDLPGLAARIDRTTRQLAQRTDMSVTFTVDPALMSDDAHLRARPSVVGEAWYIIQEALTNVERHADATSIVVRLGCDGGDLIGEVVDDGVGIWSLGEAWAHGMGLSNMRERACAVKGHVQVTVDRGTAVAFRLPLVPPA